MAKRTIIKDRAGKRRYAKRNRKGRFTDIQDIGRSSRRDQATPHTKSDR